MKIQKIGHTIGYKICHKIGLYYFCQLAQKDQFRCHTSPLKYKLMFESAHNFNA